MRPIVSAIIVTWNSEAYIDACLTSLFNQTYPDQAVLYEMVGYIMGRGGRYRLSEIDLSQSRAFVHQEWIALELRSGHMSANVDQ